MYNPSLPFFFCRGGLREGEYASFGRRTGRVSR